MLWVYPYIPDVSHHHKYATTWTINNTSHWHKCTDCEDATDEGDHVYGGECDTTCNVCGYTRVVDALHIVADTWSTDATKTGTMSTHWHYEEIMPELWDPHPSHSYTNDCDDTCNVCGYTREVTHAWDTTTYHYNSTNHWYECSACGTKDTLSDHTYTNIDDIACICGHIRDITQAYYTTKYYVENLAGTGYDVMEETTNNIGTIGETFNATIKTYTHFIHDTTATAIAGLITGFTYDEDNSSNVTSGAITSDGGLVLKLYYNRRNGDIIIQKGTGISTVSVAGTGVSQTSETIYNVRYGATVTLSATASDGYTFSGWTRGIGGSATTITGNTIIQDAPNEIYLPANATVDTYAVTFSGNATDSTISITTINAYIFYDTKITSLHISASVTSILESSFENCGYLETITVASDNTKYMSQDNCLIDNTTNTLIRGCKNSIIPTNKIEGTDNYLVTKNGGWAFTKIQATDCICIPSNITEIGGLSSGGE